METKKPSFGRINLDAEATTSRDAIETKMAELEELMVKLPEGPPRARAFEQLEFCYKNLIRIIEDQHHMRARDAREKKEAEEKAKAEAEAEAKIENQPKDESLMGLF